VRRGDVVIFRSVEDPQIDLVKRCIGIPGDVLQMREKVLTINGKQCGTTRPTPSIAIRGCSPISTASRRTAGGGTTSADHRAARQVLLQWATIAISPTTRAFWGLLPAENVKGRPVFIYWSYGGETPDGKWRGWADRLQQLAHTALGFVPRTRWSRTFHLIR
jgi:signal peptidase I